MANENELIERYRRDMMACYEKVADREEEKAAEAEMEEKEEEVKTEEGEKESDIALCRFEVRKYPADEPCEAQIILKHGDEMSILMVTDVEGKSATAAAYLTEEREEWSVSVYSSGCYSVREAKIEMIKGRRLEIPVKLEEKPDSALIFKRTAGI